MWQCLSTVDQAYAPPKWVLLQTNLLAEPFSSAAKWDCLRSLLRWQRPQTIRFANTFSNSNFPKLHFTKHHFCWYNEIDKEENFHQIFIFHESYQIALNRCFKLLWSGKRSHSKPHEHHWKVCTSHHRRRQYWNRNLILGIQFWLHSAVAFMNDSEKKNGKYMYVLLANAELNG